MAEYKTYAIIEGKPRWIIVNENGSIINNNPNSKELKSAHVQSRKYKRISDEELLNFLEIFYEKNGRIPMTNDFLNNPEYPSFVVYQKHFGSWNNALKLAGLDSREKYARIKKYTNEDLLNFLNIFYEENEKVPARRDFLNNPSYPNYQNYTKNFGSWDNALKLVGLDLDTMVKQGVLETNHQKGRWDEIIIRDHFEKDSIDLSGNNRSSIIDGICPNGQTYDAKSAKLLTIGKWRGWIFHTINRDKDDDREAIQWYYFIAFNEDYTQLLYVWRVPGEIIEKNNFHVGMYGGEFNVKNMKEYNITIKFKKMLNNGNCL